MNSCRIVAFSLQRTFFPSGGSFDRCDFHLHSEIFPSKIPATTVAISLSLSVFATRKWRVGVEHVSKSNFSLPFSLSLTLRHFWLFLALKISKKLFWRRDWRECRIAFYFAFSLFVAGRAHESRVSQVASQRVSLRGFGGFGRVSCLKLHCQC